ncbi:MAG TPA: hypothetical protein DET40_04315 [Lentisphaeria bacterium]|nr:MAG: hypothetical protein A2X45_11320 [Lentisphaerae bacterium GWF2_50_93]HCE42750.1 hypothetical protein [Lentisphaeria bacterium]
MVKIWKGKNLIGIMAVIIAAGICTAADADTISCNTAWVPEGGASAPARVEQVNINIEGKEVPAAKFILSRRNSWPKIFLPTKDINLTEYNTVTCRIKLELPAGEKCGLSFYVLDSKGDWASTSFAKHSKQLPDGDYLFKWDVIYQPDLVRSFSADKFNRLAIGYDFPNIPEGQNVVITISEVQFHGGQRAQTGDPALFEKWQKYISAYVPDYSDSSKYLLPPESGRLKVPLALTVNGEPHGEIILVEPATDVERNAASELQLWIKGISGAEIPIVHVPTETDNIKIFLGLKFASKYDTDISVLKDSDGFAVRTDGKNVHIFGALPKGTLNGVFAFIENNSDLIWARPHPEYGTVFSKNPELKIVWADAVSRPGSKYRGWLVDSGGGVEDFPIWCNRNLNNYHGGEPKPNIKWGNHAEFGGGHNLQSFIPKGDPAYYPVIKGEKPKELSIWKHQICMNAPDLVQVYSRNFIDYISKKAPPGIDAANIKIEDNWGVCECEKCTAPIKLPDGGTLDVKDPAFRSTQFYDFLNKVTIEINKVYPNLKVQTYAYFFTAIPPEIKINPNIRVLFCPYVRKDHRTPLCSPINDHWYKMAKGFALKGNVLVREYYGILTAGRPLAEVVAWDVKDYLSRGTSAFAAEIMPDGKRVWWDGVVRGAGDDWDFNMMEFWLINRIYWNPNADVEALRKYYIRRTFREAAPEMEKFFGNIRQEYYKGKNPTDWMEGASLVSAYVIKAGNENEMRELLSQALKKATNPTSRILIARIQERFEQYIGQAKKNDVGNQGKPEQALEYGLNLIKKLKPLLLSESKTAQAWEYGWNSEGNNCSIRRTTIEINGKFIDAQHMIFYGQKDARHILRCPFKFDTSNLKFQYTIIPSPETAKMQSPLPALSIIDEKGTVENAPESAYVTGADNSVQFNWNPAGQGTKGEKLDLSKVIRLIFSYPYSKIPAGKSAEFYLFDTEIK